MKKFAFRFTCVGGLGGVRLCKWMLRDLTCELMRVTSYEEIVKHVLVLTRLKICHDDDDRACVSQADRTRSS